MNRPLMAVSLLLSLGCSTTSTVSTMRGTFEGRITRGDEENLFVASEAGAALAIPRKEITDIDHPGNVAAVIGGILGGYGILNIFAGLPACNSNGSAYCTGVFLPASIGIPMFAWGMVTWLKSTSMVESGPAPAEYRSRAPVSAQDPYAVAPPPAYPTPPPPPPTPPTPAPPADAPVLPPAPPFLP